MQTKPYAEDDSLLIICSDEDVVPGTVLSEEETDKPILRKGRIVYYTKLMNILPLYVSFDAASADPAMFCGFCLIFNVPAFFQPPVFTLARRDAAGERRRFRRPHRG